MIVHYYLKLKIFIIACILISFEKVNSLDSDGIFKDVQTADGIIRGKKEYTIFDSKPYYSFKGVPYAKSPIKGLRFKPPQKTESWSGILNAFDFGSNCIQIVRGSILGDEDCLYLNIYVPIVNPMPNENFAVVINVHGGGLSGSGMRDRPDFMMLNADVIMISFNYRLGILGFLSLNTPEYSGNMGLKDQVMAFQWVRDNIEYFGGDKNRITLYGHSAGAISVDYHLMSPLSRGLFHRAIIASGSSLMVQAYNTVNHTEFLLNLGLRIHYPFESFDDLMGFLKEVDIKLILYQIYQRDFPARLGRDIKEMVWSPVIEHPDTVKPFLNQSPTDYYFKNGFNNEVDTLYGSTNAESLSQFTPDMWNPSVLQNFINRFEINLPLKTPKISILSKEYKMILGKIRGFYFNDLIVDYNQTVGQFFEVTADIWYSYGVFLRARRQAKFSAANTFYYVFSVDGQLNFYKEIFGVTAFKGATHADDINYLFIRNTSVPIPMSTYTDIKRDSFEWRTIGYMNQLVSQFARFGHPAPENNPIQYKQFGEDNFSYIEITNDGLLKKNFPRKRNYDFLDGILHEHKDMWVTRSRAVVRNVDFPGMLLRLLAGVVTLAISTLYKRF